MSIDVALKWFEGPITQSVNSVFDALNKKVEAADILKKYTKAHYKAQKTILGQINILGMGAPINLVDIYYPARISKTIHSRLYMEEWLSVSADKQEKYPHLKRKAKGQEQADKFIENNQRVVVLGGPGSGKTTLLKYLALAYSEEKMFERSNLKASLFPIYISLPDYWKSGETSIVSYFSKKLAKKTDAHAESFIHKILNRGQSILLLDSIDEVPAQHRPDITKEILDLSEDYPDSKIVVSCRTADYEHILNNFFEVEIIRLTKTAVKKIIKAWFRDDSKKADQLIRNINADEAVSSLTETPLLLGLLCIQFRHDLTLPKRKTDLFKRCIDALLREWDTSRGFRRDSAYSDLSDERKERIFEHVAGYYFNEEVEFTFSEEGLIEQIGRCCARFYITPNETPGILREIESHHGILERHSAEFYSFSHPSFQEYFAARCMISKRKEVEIVKKYYENEHWASVIEFMVAMMQDPEPILSFLCDRSTMTTSKTYPAMARRTKTLWLLYRCLSVDPTIEMESCKMYFEHIIKTQIEMARIYREGGIFPIGVLEEDGVRHTYWFTNKRPTLYQALQPFRMLANTILMLPSSLYAEMAFQNIDYLIEEEGRIDNDSLDALQNIGLILCILVPLASKHPDGVASRLEILKGKEEIDSRLLDSIIDESSKSLTQFI